MIEITSAEYAAYQVLIEAAQAFINKVDIGAARSKDSYASFKCALETIHRAKHGEAA